MSTFLEVKDPILRAFNRYAFLRNIMEDAGRAYAEEYVEQFNTVDQTNIALVAKLIKKQGYKATVKFIRENVVFEDDVIKEVA
jgi:hypothetical protein